MHTYTTISTYMHTYTPPFPHTSTCTPFPHAHTVELRDVAFNTVTTKPYAPEATGTKPYRAKSKAAQSSCEETKPPVAPSAQPAVDKSTSAGVCDKTPSSLGVQDAEPPTENAPLGGVTSQVTAGKKKRKNKSGLVAGEGGGGGENSSSMSSDQGPCAELSSKVPSAKDGSKVPSAKEMKDDSVMGTGVGCVEGTGDPPTAISGTGGEAKGKRPEPSELLRPGGGGKVESRQELLAGGLDMLPARTQELRSESGRERVQGCGDGGKPQDIGKIEPLEGAKKHDESVGTESKFRVQKSSDVPLKKGATTTPGNGPLSLKNSNTSGGLRAVTNQEDVTTVPTTTEVVSGGNPLSSRGGTKMRKTTARDKFKECENCHTEISDKIRVCSACKRVAYCNSDCQKEHWKVHKQTCSYYLKKDVTG